MHDLEQVLLFRMSVRLPHIIPEGPLASTVFNLINWCDAQGRIPELIDAIAAERQLNGGLQQVVTPENLGPLLARVRKLLLALYPDLDEFVILFEDTLGNRFESVASSGKAESQMHTVVQWANANRRFRLCPLLAAVALQHPNSDELTELRNHLCHP